MNGSLSLKTRIGSIKCGRKYTQSSLSAQVLCLHLTLHCFGSSKLSATCWTTSRELINLNSAARFKVLSIEYPSPLTDISISSREISLRMLPRSTRLSYLAMVSKHKTTRLLKTTTNRCRTSRWFSKWSTSLDSLNPSINSSINSKCTMKTLASAALTLR